MSFSPVFGHDCSLDTAALFYSSDDIRAAKVAPHDDQMQRDTWEGSICKYKPPCFRLKGSIDLKVQKFIHVLKIWGRYSETV